MSEETLEWDVDAMLLAEADEWIAAQVRQLFRAHRAMDEKAEEVELTYLDHYFTLTVRRLLRRQDAGWDGTNRYFDGLGVRPEFPSEGILRLRGEVCWMVAFGACYFDPFDAVIELCPRTGLLVRYEVRVGDHRPLEQKVHGSAVAGLPMGEWAYIVVREPPAPTSTPGRPGP